MPLLDVILAADFCFCLWEEAEEEEEQLFRHEQNFELHFVFLGWLQFFEGKIHQPRQTRSESDTTGLEKCVEQKKVLSEPH